jgi:tetratricopeptide (TPR) repeat protein
MKHRAARTRPGAAPRRRHAAGLLRAVLPTLAAALVLAAATAAWRSRPGPVRREQGLDVLLVTVDTLRADALGAYGQARPTSPNIDRLARGGVRFTSARAHNTITLPSHANILSGRLPPDHGVRDNSGFRFPSEVDTLATVLHGRGYRTAAFVSSVTVDSRFGLDRGFEVYDDAFGRPDPRGLDLPERAGVSTVARAAAWIAGVGSTPWLCWVHLYEPHAPYAPGPPWREAFRDAPYLGEVAAADAALGPLLQPILDRGAASRTLVVLTADHGESLGEHGERTHGLFAYEATLRVPLIVYAPRLLRPRTVTADVGHVDLLPTILDAVEVPAPGGLAGRSLLAAAAGHALDARATYFEALSSSLGRGWAPLHGVVDGGFKFIDVPIPELYRLAHDPGERSNLVEAEARRLEPLRRRLAALRGDTDAITPRAEDAELRERLAAVGYLGAPQPRGKAAYGPEDDPKRLVHLDGLMQEAIDRRRTGDLRGARDLARRVVGERPDMTAALLQLALVERELGDLDGAVRTLERAVASSREDFNPAMLLAGLLGETGQAERGLSILAPWLDRAQPPVDVLKAGGVLLARRNRHAEALALFERAREMDPSDALTLVHVATVHLAAGNRSAARAALLKSLRREDGPALAHRLLGLLALAEGRHAEAESRFRAALERERDDADALLNLGRLLAARGRAEEARPLFERFLVVAPRDVYAEQAVVVRAWLQRHPPAPRAAGP